MGGDDLLHRISKILTFRQLDSSLEFPILRHLSTIQRVMLKHPSLAMNLKLKHGTRNTCWWHCTCLLSTYAFHKNCFNGPNDTKRGCHQRPCIEQAKYRSFGAIKGTIRKKKTDRRGGGDAWIMSYMTLNEGFTVFKISFAYVM